MKAGIENEAEAKEQFCVKFICARTVPSMLVSWSITVLICTFDCQYSNARKKLLVSTVKVLEVELTAKGGLGREVEAGAVELIRATVPG